MYSLSRSMFKTKQCTVDQEL